MRSKSIVMPAAALLAALTFGPGAQAQGMKIGVIDMQGALLGTKDGQKVAQELQTKFAPKEAEFNKRGQDLAAGGDGRGIKREGHRMCLSLLAANRPCWRARARDRIGQSDRIRNPGPVSPEKDRHAGCGREGCLIEGY